MLKRPGSPLAFLRHQGGATAIEYALIASLISLGILAGLAGTGDSVTNSFQNLMEDIAAALG